MRFPYQPTFVVKALLTIAATFVAANSANAQQDVSALFDQAAENFKPVTDEGLADARAKLEQRVREFERFIRPSTPKGQRWLRYLHWDEVKVALKSDKPDLRALHSTYQLLNRDENGLEMQQFRRLADALQRYIQVAQIAQQADQQQYYRGQLEALERQLDEYRREPSDATSYEIGRRVEFLEAVSGPELVGAVRREFVRPNAYMEIATAYVAEGAEPINRREPVTDCILGTSIRSDARTKGVVGVSSIPSEDKAVLDFISEGRTRSHNVGNNGPAVIRSNAETDFTATKRVELTDSAFHSRPSRADATTDTHIYSVAKRGGGFGSRIVSNIGWNRARQSEHRAEAIAADHAEDRIERRVDEEVNEEMRKARKQYEEEYRRPLIRRGALPEHIRFSSDKDSLQVEVAQATRGQLAASGAPPEAPAGHDMSMRLHDSAVNNYSAIMLAGATASETEPGQDVKFDVKLPEWMKDAWKKRKVDPASEPADNQPFKPWSLTFRSDRPLSVNFADNKVKVTIRIARLRSGEKSFSNWDVTGIYTPELADGGVILRRQEDLTMLPADFRGSLSPRQTAERRNLEEELNSRSAQGRGFPKSIELDALEPEGSLADAGPLEFNQFDSNTGWLTVAWDRQSKRN
jgi:hypothetical protein